MVPVVEQIAVEAMSAEGALPIAFGPPDRPLMGFYHPPESFQSRTVAVVLCNPLGYEAMSAHRTYRHLAEKLAEQGFAALRFDYDGTGDSSGHLDDQGRVRAWIESIKAAIEEARARAGTRHVALFGLRFGATLAALAAIEHGHVDSLMAWAPVVSGRAHVRDLRAFRMMMKTPPPRSADGSEEVGGYFFGRETLDEMAAIDLLAIPDRVAARTLVLTRGERHADESRLAENWRARSAETRLLVDNGYARMMRDDPYDSIVPSESIDAIVTWLGDVRYSGDGLPPRSSPPFSVLSITAREAKGALKETPLVFGKHRNIFGVLTEPAASVRLDRPVLCFLNVGANHHVGPHRMNVELAREFASLGYRTFRLDVAGLGESPASPGTRENRIYTKDSVVDVQSAMTTLGQVCGAHRFVLIGLCSGAYLAFHTAVEDPRVVGQVLLSPYAFEWQEGDPVAPTLRKVPFHSTRFYRRRFFESSSWFRLFRGDVAVRAIAGALFERVKTRIREDLPTLLDSLRGRNKPQNEVEKAFGAMCDRGVESLMVLSFEDGGLDMVARYLGSDAHRMRRRKNFKFEIVDGSDHTFTSMASQTLLRELLVKYVTDTFA